MLLPQIVQSGVANDYIPSCISGGSEVGFYDGYVISGGSAVQIYKRSVEWTYNASQVHDSFFGLVSYGSTSSQSAKIEGNGTSYSGSGVGTCTVVYTFSDPLTLKSGQTINIHSVVGDGVGTTSLKLGNDSSAIHSWNAINNSENYTYTVPSDRTISSITAISQLQIGINHSATCWIEVTINSDYGSFLLNNSNTSN